MAARRDIGKIMLALVLARVTALALFMGAYLALWRVVAYFAQ